MATIERYQPAPPPFAISAELRRYLDDELNRIARQINMDWVYLAPLDAAPTRPENGMIVYADGTNWDPGSGEGVYAYEAGAWQKL